MPPPQPEMNAARSTRSTRPARVTRRILQRSSSTAASTARTSLDAAPGPRQNRRVDQLSAHLDRGWDLAQKGDAAGANACARRALEIDSQSPEVHNLLGYTSALSGESEEALEHYKQAIALD